MTNSNLERIYTGPTFGRLGQVPSEKKIALVLLQLWD